MRQLTLARGGVLGAMGFFAFIVAPPPSAPSTARPPAAS